MSPAPRVGVVGHVEWVEFAVVAHVPRPGEIVHAREAFEEPGGGGAVAAVQLRRLAGAATFLTVVGEDELGERAACELRERHAVDVRCVRRSAAQRRGFTYLDDDAERTITIVGPRLVPTADDDLPYDELATWDAVYFTGGDVFALEAARAARVLVATARALDTIERAGVRLDVLVGSATDPGEAIPAGRVDPPPTHVVLTHGAAGGSWSGADGSHGAWAAEPLPGPPVDSYGCGDSFAAGLAYGLGAGLTLAQALALGARCGAYCVTGRGPYGAQLTLG